MKKKTTWNETYRDIPIEVCNWYTEGIGQCWAFYLYIRLDQMPKHLRKRFWLKPEKSTISPKRKFYNYSGEPLINNLDWHCGCTYYSKHGHDGNTRTVQIGCDYQHYWDEGRNYNIEYVMDEARSCVDSLWEMIPNILRWCNYCGEYFPPQENEKRCLDCVEK